MDFTLSAYKQLISTLQFQGYFFQTFEEYIQNSKEKVVILRHDVDRKPGNALVVAKIERDAGIKASYYFRIVKESYDENVIRQIAEMGHEIGYHYENLSEINYLAQRRKGAKKNKKQEIEKRKEELYELAIDDFRLNLEKFREFYPVKTICMHGSPLSKYDNKKIWEKYDYRDYGIIAEPYFDIDFDEVFYITDTGRSWNNSSSSVRDRVKSSFDIAIQSTSHLIALAEQNTLPHQIMINVHPQRWTDNPVEWMKELVWQNVKNVVKYFYVRTLKRGNVGKNKEERIGGK